MKKTIHGVLVLVAALCVLPAAYGQSDAKDTQDSEQRFNIEMTAALNNEPEAQFRVAEMYEKGSGTPQNLRMAHLWYLKSANQGYEPAVKKLINWDDSKLQAQQRERAEEQKRRQAEADAAAAKAAREQASAKAARERAEEQKRRQAEADAAAAKAARERAEEQKRRQAEADAAAAKAAREQAAKSAPAQGAPLTARETTSGRPKDNLKESAAKSAEKDTAEFRADPCKTPTAKFTSVCQ